MSYRVIRLPDNWESFGPRDGLEGPFSFNGVALYYSVKEGNYYNPLTDIFLSYEEFDLILRVNWN